MKNFRAYLRLFGLIIIFQTISHLLILYSDPTINSGLGLNLAFMPFINFVLIIALVFALFILFHKSPTIALILVSAGAVSNICDRIIYSGVVDWLNFFGLFKFNLADLSIFLGLSFVLYQKISQIRRGE